MYTINISRDFRRGCLVLRIFHRKNDVNETMILSADNWNYEKGLLAFDSKVTNAYRVHRWIWVCWVCFQLVILKNGWIACCTWTTHAHDLSIHSGNEGTESSAWPQHAFPHYNLRPCTHVSVLVPACMCVYSSNCGVANAGFTCLWSLCPQLFRHISEVHDTMRLLRSRGNCWKLLTYMGAFLLVGMLRQRQCCYMCTWRSRMCEFQLFEGDAVALDDEICLQSRAHRANCIA